MSDMVITAMLLLKIIATKNNRFVVLNNSSL